MRVHLLIKVAMGLQALVLLVPTSLLYAVGAMGWFGLFVPAAVASLVERASREGWATVSHTVQEMLTDKFFLGFSAFMIAFGIGLFAVWFLLQSGYRGKSLKEIRWPVWAALCSGWFAAIPLAQPMSWWHLDPKFNMALLQKFQFHVLLGLGPMISSIFIVVWLYWLGRSHGRECGSATRL